MEVLTLLIAIIALVVALVAFARTGGVQDLRHQVQTLSSSSDSMRDRTADALERLEQFVRGKERPKPGGETGSSAPDNR